MFILGITGNIGSGKTTASQRLVELGALVSHSDDLAKEILQSHADILQKLSERFGSDILNKSGILQRHILAERAFATREDQLYLNQLIHPEVRKSTLSRLEIARENQTDLFVIDAPLLFEAGVDEICDAVLVVSANKFYRQGRIEQRSNILSKDFHKRDELQLSIEEKITRADYVIFNNGSLEELLKQVDQVYFKIMP